MDTHWNIPSTDEPIAGSEAGWRAVYDQFLPRLFHYFYYKTGDAHVAEELTASTFEKAWKNRHRYRARLGEYRFYLFGIAQKVAVDYFRRRRPEVGLDEVGELPGPASVEEHVEQRLDGQRLAALLRRLPEEDRTLVALKYGAELTNREIARLTGLSESNVGTRLYRLVGRLRQEWRKNDA
ncbi:MAG: sigma-70 family RNA polymerase sigma factor [Anaerolineaceae bacterium]|nr:sigma-70 family RNA polymerase sigma factor [Anaerolineaceae bacterium]